MALFKTFGMQNGGMLIFFLRSFRKVRLRKMQFLKDGVQTVVCLKCHVNVNLISPLKLKRMLYLSELSLSPMRTVN